MTFPKQGDLLDALDERLQLLDDALGQRDEPAAWRLILDALGWLHRSREEARRAIGTNDLLAVMDSDAQGETLDGLLWMRALADHEGADVQVELLHPVKIRHTADGRTVDVDLELFLNGEPVKAGPPLAYFPSWPIRSALPLGRPGRERGERRYVARVERQPIIPPLESAREFLAQL